MNKNLTLEKASLSFVDGVDFLDRKSISLTALRVIKGYKKRVKNEGAKASDLKRDPAQLIQRVQNEVVTQVTDAIKDTYYGEKFEWLPSDANEPDPEHQLMYGKIFVVGEGEFPGDRQGCRCGARILVRDTEIAI